MSSADPRFQHRQALNPLGKRQAFCYILRWNSQCMNYPAASSVASDVIPCLTEPAPYLIRGNLVAFSGFRRLSRTPTRLPKSCMAGRSGIRRNDDKRGKPLFSKEGYSLPLLKGGQEAVRQPQKSLPLTGEVYPPLAAPKATRGKPSRGG